MLKNTLNSSPDKHEGMHPKCVGGGISYITPDLSYEREGAGEAGQRKYMGWEEKQNQQIAGLIRNLSPISQEVIRYLASVPVVQAWFKHGQPHPLWGIFPRLAYEVFNEKKDGWKITMKYFQNVVRPPQKPDADLDYDAHFAVRIVLVRANPKLYRYQVRT